MLLQGTGVLMAGRTKGALQKAAAAIEAAVPSDCKKCYLHIKVWTQSLKSISLMSPTVKQNNTGYQQLPFFPSSCF